MQRPGGISHHQYDRAPTRVRTVDSMPPQEITVGSPRPRKLRIASVMIAPETVRLMYRKLNGRTFGAMCRKASRMSEAPDTRAASTKGRSLRVRTCERTTRAIPGHPRTPRTRMIVQMLGR